MNSQLLTAIHAENHTRTHDETYIGQNLSIQNTVNAAADITVSGSSQQTVTVQGKNLLPSSYESSWLLNQTTVANHVFTSNITNGALYVNTSKKIITLTPNKIYRFWIISTGGNISLVPYVYLPDGSTLAASYSINGVTQGYVEFTAPADGKVVLCVGGYVVYPITYSYYLILTDNTVTKPTTYEPFIPNSPSPEYPSEVNSVTGNLVSSNSDNSKTSSITLPTLGGIGTVKDTYTPSTGGHPQGIGIKTFNGTEGGFSIYTNLPKTQGFYIYVADAAAGTFFSRDTCMITHFIDITLGSDAEGFGGLVDTKFLYLRINKSILTDYGYVDGTTSTYVPALNAWLAVKDNAGMPIKAYYQLETPVTTTLAPARLDTYYPETHITTDGAVKATLSATVKIIGL